MLKAVILDLDGVIVLGQTLIPGADLAIAELRKTGLKVFFLSNNSSLSRNALREKLERIGVRASPEEVYPASYATAEYIAQKHPKAKVFAITTSGIDEELKLRGVAVVQDESAGIVAVGLDKNMDYRKLSIGFRALMKGALFIAANEDSSYPVEDGLLPGAGAMVGALRFSTGKKPLVIGKPGTFLLEMIMREHGLKKDEVVMVGDRFDMDIRMAKKAGIRSVLVLSGVSGKRDVERSGKMKPELVLGSLSELPSRISDLE